jgi:predicted nucleic acid-binding protein
MVVVDTSIWIDHFNRTDQTLLQLLEADMVALHPFIIGELVCGHLKDRSDVLGLLNDLPCISRITDEEFFIFVEKNHLYGMGLGFVDIHVLASTLMAQYRVYTRDKDLLAAAATLKVAFK